MSNDIGIGKLITSETAQRDAIHVAVAPVIATVRLRPGVRVGLDEEGNAELSSSDKCVGIVDPFLTADVQPGQRFWLFLFPNTVTSLRHEWRHPAFPATLDRDALDSELWLRRYAAKMNAYDEPEKAFTDLIDGLKTGHLFAHGSDLHGMHDVDDAADLKYHAERYLGIRIDWEEFTFSCSC